jgi:cytochrome c1
MRDPLAKAEVISLKRFSLVFCLVLAMSLVFVGSAFANFGPHGGYGQDTDGCAACHRAHTSFSSATFEPKDSGITTPGAFPSALLVGQSSTISDFCYACHGNNAIGAATNVQYGVFDSGPSSSATGFSGGVPVLYSTESSFNAPLNGGGFVQAAKNWDWEANATPVYQAVTSAHTMERTNVLWGAGNGADQSMYLTCTSCHDPHGSSNYRLLKDSVNGHTVGGYTKVGATYIPDAFVYSVETGYPTTGDGGWLKGDAGAAQMASYRPNYTGGDEIKSGTQGKSLSTWCAACHENYNETTGTKNYGAYEPAGVGAQVRHRHPVDVALTAGDGILQIAAEDVANGETIDPRIPLEQNPIPGGDGRDNQVGCLTCHLAHGSSQTMAGWAAASLGSAAPYMPSPDSTPGVNPDKQNSYDSPIGFGTSALLRADNRGVCERCHHK